MRRTRGKHPPTPAAEGRTGDGDARRDAVHHRVYVVRLEHPRYAGRRDCYYVGMTGLLPQERFENHKAGIKCARVVRDFGVELAYEWFDEIPPMTYDEAAQCEPTLADELRDRGFVVFGPTNRPPATRPKGRARTTRHGP